LSGVARFYSNFGGSTGLRWTKPSERPGRLAAMRFSLCQHERLTYRLLNLAVACRWLKNTRNFIQYMGRAPRYVAPRAWSDKMQWRKVFDRNLLFRVCTDKADVRGYIEKSGVAVRCPRFLWVGDVPEQIPFGELTGAYVVKPSIGSGQVIVVRDPGAVDRTEIIATCRDWLAQRDYGRREVEWGYWGRRNRLIVEEYLPAMDGQDEIGNWKFFVFNGRVAYVQLESGRDSRDYLTFFDRDGVRLPVAKWVGRYAPERMDMPDDTATVPARFACLVREAEALAAEFDHMRVDLYDLQGETWFSELTPYDGSGYSYLYQQDDSAVRPPPEDMNLDIGKRWQLPDYSWQQLLGAWLWTNRTGVG